MTKPAIRRRASHQLGGAALEYILVSTFAAVVGMAALGFIGKVIKDQLNHLASKLGSDAPPDWGDPFGNSGDSNF